MKQFDIYRNPDPQSARRTPYLVVLQSDYLSVVESVVVAPLVPLTRRKPIARLTPVIAVSGIDHVLLAHEMAAVSRATMKRVAGTAASARDEIIAALDLVFLGF